MLDKDKLILVVKFGIKGLRVKRAYEDIINCHESLISQFDDSVGILVIPVRDSKTINVEAINPQLVSEEDYKTRVLPLIENAEKVLKDFKS